ncbi:hypothetical protein HMN09_00892900 [Mycena chlorophos]|uniref:Uncharacterized protein n=1 Tax=Mycena chlorophos TaxID=658473 RepID=A0A8H6SNK0_MYCCL|nr:hypothetical protein HMN09_00892900 [Mycena chlorophos]
MLARLSQVEAAPESFSMDMENLRLILPASSSWGRIALSCIPPAGRNLLASIHHDIESVAHLLAALEPEMDLSSESEATPLATDSLNADASIRIPIPRIVVTPCPDAPRETSCWVPMQDSAFRTRLTVPLHPSLNRSFPPMAASPRRVPVKAWIWTNGHWQATTRGLEPRPRKLQCRKKKKKSRQKAGL